MSKQLDSFPVRAGRRVYESAGRTCPSCGQTDPLLIGEDGRCFNCVTGHREEWHHFLPKAFRVSREDEEAVIRVSLAAHRLSSDMQAGHPAPPTDDPASRSFLDAWMCELIVSMIELWLVLMYLDEQRDVSHALPLVVAILFGLWLFGNLDRLDLSNLVERARMKLHEEQARWP